MAIGPVQLLVSGFDHREFYGKIAAELGAGGMPLGGQWITVSDLIAIGVSAREEAEAQSAG